MDSPRTIPTATFGFNLINLTCKLIYSGVATNMITCFVKCSISDWPFDWMWWLINCTITEVYGRDFRPTSAPTRRPLSQWRKGQIHWTNSDRSIKRNERGTLASRISSHVTRETRDCCSIHLTSLWYIWPTWAKAQLALT